jgi:hypothetical protein
LCGSALIRLQSSKVPAAIDEPQIDPDPGGISDEVQALTRAVRLAVNAHDYECAASLLALIRRHAHEAPLSAMPAGGVPNEAQMPNRDPELRAALPRSLEAGDDRRAASLLAPATRQGERDPDAPKGEGDGG